jgi:2-polyprenyl-3-methyl-5-hydroxy-6-metoxy-1,4-benzoquinol methylase
MPAGVAKIIDSWQKYSRKRFDCKTKTIPRGGKRPMTLDMNRKEIFAGRITDILNAGAINLAMAIGYKHRIFDAMETLEKPARDHEIASAAKLDPRYVREWLGVMACGKIIDLITDPPHEDRYCLPPEHACFLTRGAGSSNLGVYTQEIPLLTACAMEPVMDGFRTGQGVPFSRYPDFQDFMAELSNAKHRQVLVDQFLPGVDNGNLISRLKAGIRVCDLGCGQGVALNLMARQFPASRFLGVDNHAQALETARKQALDMKLANVQYHVADAARLKDTPEYAEQFDYILALDAIHDQTRPLDALIGVKTMLAPGGIFSMVDIDASSDHAGNLEHPMGPFLYTVSLMHCMPVGLQDNGTGLGMMWGRDRAVDMLSQAGFESIEVLEMGHDPFNVHYQCR